ncbi:hypothetical protein D3C75_693900 [compost metagenome]
MPLDVIADFLHQHIVAPVLRQLLQMLQQLLQETGEAGFQFLQRIRLLHDHMQARPDGFQPKREGVGQCTLQLIFRLEDQVTQQMVDILLAEPVNRHLSIQALQFTGPLLLAQSQLPDHGPDHFRVSKPFAVRLSLHIRRFDNLVHSKGYLAVHSCLRVLEGTRNFVLAAGFGADADGYRKIQVRLHPATYLLGQLQHPMLQHSAILRDKEHDELVLRNPLRDDPLPVLLGQFNRYAAHDKFE